jgi:hypothetical protein
LVSLRIVLSTSPTEACEDEAGQHIGLEVGQLLVARRQAMFAEITHDGESQTRTSSTSPTVKGHRRDYEPVGSDDASSFEGFAARTRLQRLVQALQRLTDDSAEIRNSSAVP